MTTDIEQLHREFIRDFTELLERYDAEFERGSGHYGETAEVSFHGIYTSEGGVVRPYSCLTLPAFLS